MSKRYQLSIKFNIKRVYIIMKEREYAFSLIVQTLLTSPTIMSFTITIGTSG